MPIFNLFFYTIMTIAIIIILFSLILKITNNTEANKRKPPMKNKQIILQYLLEQNRINEQQMEEIMRMSLEEQNRFIQQQFIDEMNYFMEVSRLQNTGVELGGYNVDPALNPGMQMQQEQMNNFNNFTNHNF